MGLFDIKREIPRRELREKLKRSPARAPGTPGKIYSWRERVKMEKELFPHERFKSHISKQEVIERLRGLRKEKHYSPTRAEKIRIDRKIRYLKNLAGIEKF